jgi:pyridinium-3,5-bisthiocarboxylic acid mononucleotide nickel chelatase
MIAYLDMPSGISGNIFLGCLMDAGWPQAALVETVRRLDLPAEQWSIQVEPAMRGPLRATLVTVDTPETHHHRHLSDIRSLIERADLPKPVQERAIAVFARLARAEAKVHGTTVEQIHFHEVGAVDAIVDIVGVVAGLHDLGVEDLYAGALPLGAGWATTAHGRIPLPAPATLELLSAVQAPTRPAPGPGELVTPTGAALVAELARFEQPALDLHRVGLGAGHKEFEWPNVARLWLGELTIRGTMLQFETNIDDMNPELYSAVSDKLFAAGARDVWTSSIQMKKNRPGTLLCVLAPAAREQAMVDLLLRETTTLGMRVFPVWRHEARREMRVLETHFGSVQVKLKWVDGDLVGVKPEYEDCRRLADLHGASLRQVYEVVQAAAQNAFLRVDGDQAAR